MVKVMAVNAGSSSLKFQLINMPSEEVITSGLVERIGQEVGNFVIKVNGEKIQTQTPIPDHQVAVDLLLNALVDHHIVESLEEIDAVGHRVVHEGEDFDDSVVVDEEAVKKVADLAELAPLHNPANIIGYKAFKEALPDHVGHVFVFDTAFHQTLDKERYLYPLPLEYYTDLKVRKYGAHGTSHKYVSQQAIEMLGNPKESRIIVCHLGNGASVSAVQDGKCIDTSMGFTPLAGVMMGTRSGDVDPSVMPYLCKKLNIKIGITTNGLLIDKHMEAIAKFADWTRVSMDAGNPKTFNVVRPNRFNIICKNISTLSKIKNGKLGYSFLLIENKKLNYSNVSDLFQAAELAKNLGCDYFEYKPMVDENHFLVKYSDEFMNELDNITKKISLLEDEKFKIIYPQSMNQYKEKNLVQYKKYKMCPVTYLRTLITPYGIYPCPYKRGYEKYNIGNIKENSFKNIWNYYKFENHCKEINACKDCNFFCIRDKLNQELLKLVKNPYLIDNIDFGETKDVFV